MKIPKKKRKKIKKSLSRIIYCQNGRRMAVKERKKILVPNSIHTRSGEENSEKKMAKEFKKLKTFSGIICSQNGMTQAEKERKKFQSRILSLPHSCKKIPKKIAKKFKKIKKVNSGIISIQNRLREAEKEKKKNLVPNSVHTRSGQENSKKKQQKNSKTSFQQQFQLQLNEIG